MVWKKAQTKIYENATVMRAPSASTYRLSISTYGLHNTADSLQPLLPARNSA